MLNVKSIFKPAVSGESQTEIHINFFKREEEPLELNLFEEVKKSNAYFEDKVAFFSDLNRLWVISGSKFGRGLFSET